MNRPNVPPPSALVAVLGDLGRSPRMLNHARRLLARGWTVTLAGLRETELPADLAAHAGVRVLGVDLEVEAEGAPRARARWRLLRLLAAQRPDWRLAIVQNPPGFPVLLALALARWRRRGARRTTVVVDWHNLGHAVFAHAGRGPAGVALYRRLEFSVARRADAHWAVSAALAAHVTRELGGVPVTVLRDEPPAALCRAASVTGDRLDWWRETLPGIAPPPDGPWLVMPSSWTRDERTDWLLAAIRTIAAGEVGWPERRRLTVIATGRGAGRAAFTAAFPAQPQVALRSAWLPAAAYAELLGHADAGLCLHGSASGLDLPMKLADLRGAGLPAIACDYGPVVREVFSPGAHGWPVRDARELAAVLATLAGQPPPRRAFTGDTWETAWKAVEPLVARLEGEAIERRSDPAAK